MIGESKGWLYLDNSEVNRPGMNSALINMAEFAFEYDILEMQYTISATFIWFGYYWRRREGEEISCRNKKVKYYIPEEEIHSIPLFVKQFPECQQEGFDCSKIARYVLSDEKVKIAILKKYAARLAERLSDPNFKGYSIERICSLKGLPDKLYKEFPEMKNTITENEIKNCVISV